MILLILAAAGVALVAYIAATDALGLDADDQVHGDVIELPHAAHDGMSGRSQSFNQIKFSAPVHIGSDKR